MMNATESRRSSGVSSGNPTIKETLVRIRLALAQRIAAKARSRSRFLRIARCMRAGTGRGAPLLLPQRRPPESGGPLRRERRRRRTPRALRPEQPLDEIGRAACLALLAVA